MVDGSTFLGKDVVPVPTEWERDAKKLKEDNDRLKNDVRSLRKELDWARESVASRMSSEEKMKVFDRLEGGGVVKGYKKQVRNLSEELEQANSTIFSLRTELRAEKERFEGLTCVEEQNEKLQSLKKSVYGLGLEEHKLKALCGKHGKVLDKLIMGVKDTKAELKVLVDSYNLMVEKFNSLKREYSVLKRGVLKVRKEFGLFEKKKGVKRRFKWWKDTESVVKALKGKMRRNRRK